MANTFDFKPLGDPARHYWLVQRMARATGVDLAAGFSEGRFDNAAWSDMVTTCRGCRWTDGCERWLAKDGEDGADKPAPPQGCRNRARLACLRLEEEIS